MGGPRKTLKVWAKTNGYCWYCGKVLQIDNFTRDHIIPQKSGGTNDISNLVPCCKNCNSSKGTKSVEDFRAKMQERKANHDYNYVTFTEQQIKYLKSIGFDTSKIKPLRYQFYFERMGRGEAS